MGNSSKPGQIRAPGSVPGMRAVFRTARGRASNGAASCGSLRLSCGHAVNEFRGDISFLIFPSCFPHGIGLKKCRINPHTHFGKRFFPKTCAGNFVRGSLRPVKRGRMRPDLSAKSTKYLARIACSFLRNGLYWKGKLEGKISGGSYGASFLTRTAPTAHESRLLEFRL